MALSRRRRPFFARWIWILTRTGLVLNESPLASDAVEGFSFSSWVSSLMVLEGACRDFVAIVEVVVAAIVHFAAGALETVTTG